MTSGRYPTEEEAKATFSDEEFNSLVDKRLDEKRSIDIVRFETYNNKHMLFDANLLKEIARLIKVLPYACYFEGNSIIRIETLEEAEHSIISDRRSEMHYKESSPFYAAHMKSDSDE